MEKVKERRRNREKNKLSAKLLQHERSKRINRGEDPKVVDADLKRRMEEQNVEKAEETKVESKANTDEQELALAKRIIDTESNNVRRIISDSNICDHATGEEMKIGQILEAMIQKLIDAGKAVTDFNTP